MDPEEDILRADANEASNHRPLVNQNPYFFGAALSSLVSFLEAYGWFLVLGSIFALVVWTNVRGHITKFFGRRKRAYDVTDSLNADQIEARMIAMDEARRRMQERYDTQVRVKAEKLQELEEQKRSQKINDHDAMKHGKSQSNTLHKLELKTDSNPTPNVVRRNKDAKPLRSNDSSPLGGSGGSSRWRPSQNRPSAGG